MNTNYSLKLLLTCLVVMIGVNYSFAEGQITKEEILESLMDNNLDVKDFDDCNCHESALKLKQLCAKKICVKCFKAHQAHIKDLSTDKFCTSLISGTSICADNLNINQSACIPTLTSSDIQTSNLCVTGAVRASEFCGRYKAFAEFAADTLYTLDTLVNFDNIVDDPNGNILIAPFSYTAPVTGYYLVTVQLLQHGLVTSDPVLGLPTARLQLLVNGLQVRDSFTPYLTFSNQQKSLVASLVRLNAGDVLQTQYGILQVTDSGLASVTGTVIIEGGDHKTLFAVHYLSSDCNPTSCEPRTCQPCETHCNPVPCVCD